MPGFFGLSGHCVIGVSIARRRQLQAEYFSGAAKQPACRNYSGGGVALCDGAIRYAIPCKFLDTFIPFGVFPLVRPQMGECVEEFTSSYAPLKTAPDCRARRLALLNSYSVPKYAVTRGWHLACLQRGYAPRHMRSGVPSPSSRKPITSLGQLIRLTVNCLPPRSPLLEAGLGTPLVMRHDTTCVMARSKQGSPCLSQIVLRREASGDLRQASSNGDRVGLESTVSRIIWALLRAGLRDASRRSPRTVAQCRLAER